MKSIIECEATFENNSDRLIDCFMAHQHRKAISAKKRC